MYLDLVYQWRQVEAGVMPYCCGSEGTVSKRLGHHRSAVWLKIKNPEAPAVRSASHSKSAR
jgi:hypothetical protein